MKTGDFKAQTKQKLAERAGFICSNPSCYRVTIGPCVNNPHSSTKVGEAAHICAASPGGPRYDMSQTEAQRRGIDNGIWLCPSCASLIDKNGGIDYPAPDLKRWKKDHETLINLCLEGNRRVVFSLAIVDPNRSDVRSLVKFLEQRGALFQPFQNENHLYVIDSIAEIRTFLTQLLARVEEGSRIAIIVESLNRACRHFMNTTSKTAPEKEVLYALGALRKMFGVNLKDIQDSFSVKITGPLADFIPK